MHATGSDNRLVGVALELIRAQIISLSTNTWKYAGEIGRPSIKVWLQNSELHRDKTVRYSQT